MVVGRIKGVHGVRGELTVESLTDVAERFSPGSVLYVEGKAVTVEASRRAKKGLLVKLGGVQDRNAAEALRGKLLTVPSSEVRPLPEGSYYHFQVLDMDVWTHDGGYLGRLEEVLTTPGNDVYVVRGPGGQEALIPALGDVVLEVDLDGGRMVVRVPEIL